MIVAQMLWRRKLDGVLKEKEDTKQSFLLKKQSEVRTSPLKLKGTKLTEESENKTPSTKTVPK